MWFCKGNPHLERTLIQKPQSKKFNNFQAINEVHLSIDNFSNRKPILLIGQNSATFKVKTMILVLMTAFKVN